MGVHVYGKKCYSPLLLVMILQYMKKYNASIGFAKILQLFRNLMTTWIHPREGDGCHATEYC